MPGPDLNRACLQRIQSRVSPSRRVSPGHESATTRQSRRLGNGGAQRQSRETGCPSSQSERSDLSGVPLKRVAPKFLRQHESPHQSGLEPSHALEIALDFTQGDRVQQSQRRSRRTGDMHVASERDTGNFLH